VDDEREGLKPCNKGIPPEALARNDDASDESAVEEMPGRRTPERKAVHLGPITDRHFRIYITP